MAAVGKILCLRIVAKFSDNPFSHFFRIENFRENKTMLTSPSKKTNIDPSNM
jgi:hypothetical protein